MLEIDDDLAIPDADIRVTAIRASGPGGQNVNKVATAVHLRFDITSCSALGEDLKQRLLSGGDRRISAAGVVNIKAQRFRSLEKNRADALDRLAALIRASAAVPARRRKTRPGRQANEIRLAEKARRAKRKQSRARLPDYDD